MRNAVRRFCYIGFAIIILILSWEYNLSNAALAEANIPEDSIRLRILAHSDSPRDQWLKRQVRDAIVEQMNIWVHEQTMIDDARAIAAEKLPIFEQVVKQVIKEKGFNYSFTIELGEVDFPTKLYGSKVYPAGEYEALRITIGSGAGENWWCVLFPPLCFIDLTTGEAVASGDVAQLQDGEASSEMEDAEVRFFLWDMFKKIGSFIEGLFN